MWKFLEKLPFFRADMAGLGKYCMGGYGRIGVYRVKLLAILKFTLFDRGTRKGLHCLERGGGVQKVLDPRFSHLEFGVQCAVGGWVAWSLLPSQ